MEFHRVQTREQAELLSDPVACRYLEPFLARESSVSDAAESLGVGIDTLLYRVRKFLAAGLLEIVREEPRAGRPIKIYRTVADGFYVPFGLTDFAEHEEQARDQLRAGEDVIIEAMSSWLRETGQEGRRIFRAPDGEVWIQSAGDEGKPAEWGDYERMRAIPGPAYESFAAEVFLTDDQSKDFLIELYELYERHAEISDANRAEDRGRAFLFRFQLAREHEP